MQFATQLPQLAQRHLNWFFRPQGTNRSSATPTVDIEMGIESTHTHLATANQDPMQSDPGIPCGSLTANDLILKLHSATLSDADTETAGDVIATLPANTPLSECLMNPLHTDALVTLHQLKLIDLNHFENNPLGNKNNAIQSLCLKILDDSASLPETVTGSTHIKSTGVLGHIYTMIQKLATADISPDGHDYHLCSSPLQVAALREEPIRNKLFLALANAGADLLRFAAWYPQTVASDLVKAYADIWPKCIEILRSNELKSQLEKSSLALGIVAGVTLTATGYSIYNMTKDWRYRSRVNSAIKALNEPTT